MESLERSLVSVLVLLMCVFAGEACGSPGGQSGEDDDLRKRPRDAGAPEAAVDASAPKTGWNLNDVSILYPRPKSNEQALLLSMTPPGTAGASKILLPAAVFGLLGDQSSGFQFLTETPDRDQLYPR